MNSEKLSLWIALLLPIIAVILTVLVVVLPQKTSAPSGYDFLYTSEMYNLGYSLEVQNGHLVKQPFLDQNNRPIPIKGEMASESAIYYHDVIKNESRKLTFDEAAKITLAEGYVSPDGYEVICGNSNRGVGLFEALFGGGGDCTRRFLINRDTRASTPVKLTLKDQWNFRLLGWVKR